MIDNKLNLSLKNYNSTCLFLEKMAFVKWDRLHVNHRRNTLTVYGWIKNAKPRDFIIITFNYRTKLTLIYTSSKRPYVIKKLESFLGTSEEGIKVKGTLDIKNVVK